MRTCNHNCTLVNNCCKCDDKRIKYTKYVDGIGSIPCPRNEFYCENCKKPEDRMRWSLWQFATDNGRIQQDGYCCMKCSKELPPGEYNYCLKCKDYQDKEKDYTVVDIN